jgi:hypothetical protein
MRQNVPHAQYQRLGRRMKKSPEKKFVVRGFLMHPPAGAALSPNPGEEASFLKDPVRAATLSGLNEVVESWERLSAEGRAAILKICRSAK